MIDRDKLAALHERATKGEWEATERSGYHEILAPDATCDWYGVKNRHAVAYIDTEIDDQEQNAALIALLCSESARAEILAMMDERDRLREALQTINRKASPDPERTMSEASNDLYWCACYARAALGE